MRVSLSHFLALVCVLNPWSFGSTLENPGLQIAPVVAFDGTEMVGFWVSGLPSAGIDISGELASSASLEHRRSMSLIRAGSLLAADDMEDLTSSRMLTRRARRARRRNRHGLFPTGADKFAAGTALEETVSEGLLSGTAFAARELQHLALIYTVAGIVVTTIFLLGVGHVVTKGSGAHLEGLSVNFSSDEKAPALKLLVFFSSTFFVLIGAVGDFALPN